jgi:hypothetical protein
MYMFKLIDTLDLESGTKRCGGSSPITRTKKVAMNNCYFFLSYCFINSS